MDKQISTAVIFYAATILLSLAFCGALVFALEWPLLAELPLAGAIFIHIIAISRTLFNVWTDNKEDLVEGMVSRFKALLFKLDTQEEEVNV